MKELSEYYIQAEKFLEETKTRLEVKRSHYQKKPLWVIDKNEKHGFCYDVRLSNAKGEYIFNFWDSVANKEKEEKSGYSLFVKPSNYAILACLTAYEPESDFNDFCKMFGYEPSRMAKKTYEAVFNEWEELNKLFTAEELEKLAEIN